MKNAPGKSKNNPSRLNSQQLKELVEKLERTKSQAGTSDGFLTYLIGMVEAEINNNYLNP